MPSQLRPLNAACKAAGIAEVTYNDLRRTFASMLLDAGATNTVTAKLLRHKSTAMVDKHYGKHDDGALAALVELQGARPLAASTTTETPPKSTTDAETAVPPVYQNPQNQTPLTEAEWRILRVLVGRAGLEPATYGLKDRDVSSDSRREDPRFEGSVPRAYQGTSETSNDAIRRAVTLAMGEGDLDLASALLDVIKKTAAPPSEVNAPATVVELVSRRRT